MPPKTSEPLPTNELPRSVRTPLWRRITAFFSLGTLVIIGGLLLGTLIALAAFMMVFLVDRAIA